MERKEISKAVISRLPRYYRYLGELIEEGVERISSNELSARMKVTASQIRQDLNNFGGFGQQGYGYNVKYLYAEIAKILGIDQQHNLIIIGAGNLATNLAKALYYKGFRIVQVYSRTEESARALAEKVEADYTTDLQEISKDAKLYIVSLKDAAFVELLPQITEGKQKSLLVHTAGSIPMSVWEGHAERYGVFYPMQTFSKQREVDFQEVPFFIEAKRAEDTELLKAIASTLSEKVYEADSEQRKSLHLAAVFICNFTNHMYALAADLLEKYNLPFEVMLPLIDETARKVHELAPRDAQTGPAVRYDENVMSNHLAMLVDSPALQEIYKLMSKSIHEHHKL